VKSDSAELNQQAYRSQQVVSTYVSQIGLQPPEEMALEHYLDRLQGVSILDLGCGGGRMTPRLSRLASDYLGADYSAEMIAACRERYPDLLFEIVDARDLSRFEDGRFGAVVFAYNGLDYIDHEDRLKALDEIHRVLCDRGLFVFSTHNRNCGSSYAPPELERLYLHPRCMARNLATLRRYWRRKRNRRANAPRQIEAGEYSILNDNAQDYALLTYYIEKEAQDCQSKESGFKTLSMYGTDGKALELGQDDHQSAWVYFVVEKI
jgi:SAM-dependent methyltransferase